MSRGIISVVWGESRFFKEAQITLLRNKQATGLPVCIITDTQNEHKIEDRSQFDHVIIVGSNQIPRHHQGKGYILKTMMPQLSPFEENLYLDSDAIVVSDKLEYGFNQCKEHGLCITHDLAYSLFDYKFLEPEAKTLSASDYLIQYNAGVFFLSTAHDDARKAMLEWYNLANSCQTLVMPQALLSVAFNNTKFNPVVLPWTWNYRPHYEKVYSYGEVKIWHSRSCHFDQTMTEFYKTWKQKKVSFL